jgi:hypothetical protein
MAVVWQLGEKPKDAIMIILLIGVPAFESLFGSEEKGPTSRRPLNDKWPSASLQVPYHTAPNDNMQN